MASVDYHAKAVQYQYKVVEKEDPFIPRVYVLVRTEALMYIWQCSECGRKIGKHSKWSSLDAMIVTIDFHDCDEEGDSDLN